MMKKLFAILLVLTMVLTMAACGLGESSGDTNGDGLVQFSVIVVHGDKSEEIFLYEVQPGKLGKTLEEKGLISSEGADAGMFHTVDGEKADWNVNKSYWAFYINNEYALKGIYDTNIEDGQNYKLVYTIG